MKLLHARAEKRGCESVINSRRRPRRKIGSLSGHRGVNGSECVSLFKDTGDPHVKSTAVTSTFVDCK